MYSIAGSASSSAIEIGNVSLRSLIVTWEIRLIHVCVSASNLYAPPISVLAYRTSLSFL